eukprot:gene15211-16782_t
MRDEVEKIPLGERLKDLWTKNEDKYESFYEFFQKEVLPKSRELLKDTNTTVPAEFFSKEGEGEVSGSDFPCKLFHNHTNPKSVHELKPSDVDLVAGMGDSITAAFGAKSRNILEIFLEFRGVSWSIGGDKTLNDVTTLPNIIKEYNGNVDGFSVKITPPKISIPWRSHLNVAVSGAISIDLPGQATTLIERLKSYHNYEDSWKVLTLWIGGNDLCGYCKNDKHTVEKYIGGIRDALDLLHKEVPKMFVNLVQILDVTRLNAIKSLYCKPLHYILCKCGTSAGEEVKKKVSQMSIEYQLAVKNLIKSGRYDTRDDFTVVIQPFFEQTTIPQNPDGSADMSYIAPDCFHFSEKGHRAAALALWNSMIEPVGKKRLMWSKGENFECPPETFPYFYTNKNSKNSPMHTSISSQLTKNDANGPLIKENVRQQQKKPLQNFATGKNGSSTATLLTILTCAVVLIVVVAVVVIKRRQSQNQNEACQRLLVPEDQEASYTGINY